jgi:hypothetical protein
MAAQWKATVSRLREIGWAEWDPIGLKAVGKLTGLYAPEDEYDRYLIHVFSLLSNGASDADAIAYLVDIESNYIGMGLRPSSHPRAWATVKAIRQDFEQARSS